MKLYLNSFLFVVCTACLFARDIEYVEKFSLAEDRSVPLEELIPGTRDYYYYHALDAQNRGDQAEFDKILKAWTGRYKVTSRVREMLNRQALIDYNKDPDKSLKYIQDELNLRFNHSRKVEGSKPSHPTNLNPDVISYEAFLKRSLPNNSVSGVESKSLWKLDPSDFNENRLRDWLKRLQRPDIPGLPELITKDLSHRNSSGFGSMNIHRKLLLSQLDKLLELKPKLLDSTNFINTYLLRLAPSNDVDVRYKIDEKTRYLNRLLQFVRRLAPAHNTLKATVLHETLKFQQSQGNYDRQLFLEYLNLPRSSGNYQRATRDSLMRQNGARLLQYGQRFPQLVNVSQFPSDDTLEREFLLHFFREDDSIDGFVKYLRDVYLKPLLGEAKLVNGIGDPEKWFSLLGTSRTQSLKDRIDIDFLPNNSEFFKPSDPVNLKVAVKNVESLLVKVYRINTFNYYTRNLTSIDTTLSLDGLSATWERKIEFESAPLRRVVRTFKFPELKGRGVFVVDLIGNGRSSRCIVTKGQLRVLEKTGPAGHEFRILDGQNKPRPKATIWMNGKEYVAEKEDNVILIPYSNRPGSQSIVLRDGDFSTLDSFNHLSEQYQLSAGILVDREALLRGAKATVTVRPALRLNGWNIAPSLLEDIRLSIQTADYEGVSTSTEILIESFDDDKDFTHTFSVPAKLSSLSFNLTAKVENISKGNKQNLSVSQSYQINQIDRTLKLDAPHLSSGDGKYVLDVLGKNGEPLVDRPIYVEFKHNDFTPVINHTLKSDQDGRVHLNEMPGIQWIRVRNADGQKYLWEIEKTRHGQSNLPRVVHAKAGESIRLNVASFHGERKPAEVYSLFQLRGGSYHSSYVRSGRFDAGCLVLDDLEAGDYELYLKDLAHSIRIRISDGERTKEQDFIFSRHRHLEGSLLEPLHIADVKVEEGKAVIQLGNTTPFARVHVFATRYAPRFPHFRLLDVATSKDPYSVGLVERRALFVEDRDIGEEYRYILERQNAPKYPGNLLGRPGVLLNPWAIRDTQTERQDAKEGEDFRTMADMAKGKRVGGLGSADGRSGQSDFPNLDFLGNPTVHLANLKPGKDGTVTLNISKLAGQQHLHVVALDAQTIVSRNVNLPSSDLPSRENRMARTLDPGKPSSEQKLISFRGKDDAFELADITSSRLQVYDSLDKVFTLLLTLSGQNSNLNEFSFVLGWPSMERKAKLEKYSKYSCHELNFFLYHKDRPFFEKIIQPYLANKKDKTFMDHWLLGADLSHYSEPWAFNRLNVVEKILLARAGATSSDAMERFIQDRQDLLPPDPDRFKYLFDTAIKSSSLAEMDDIGFTDAQLDQSKTRIKSLRMMSGKLGQANVFMNASAIDELSAMPAPAAMPVPTANAEITFESIDAAGLIAQKGLESTKRASSAKFLDKKMQKLSEKEGFALNGRAASMDRLEGVDEIKEMVASEPKWYNNRLKSRQQMRQLFRQLETTKEWAENNYYKLPIESQNQNLIQVNAFWNDYAASEKNTPFFSGNFIYTSRNFTEMMLALAVLDLPFKSPEHETASKNRAFQIQPGGPILIFHEEVKDAQKAEGAGQILLSQNFYRADSRYRQVGNERLDNFVTAEFLTATAYGCQVVLTNPTSARRKLNLLLQVPMGAIPLQSGFYSKGRPQTLEPYSTSTFDYFFYFPEEGQYPIYPVQVASSKGHLSSGSKFVFKVVNELSATDKTSWAWISQNGTEKEVLAYLENHNLNRIDLGLIAFRLRNENQGGGGRAFYDKLLKLLGERFAFKPELWSYSIYHKDESRMREYLPHTSLANRSGLWLKTQLLDIDPVVRGSYQHLEYKPLVNARAHTLGKKRKILNNRFHQQYHHFMQVLKYKLKPSPKDQLAITYYLLLQDRIAEAFQHFEKANPETLDEKLQHAYLHTYLDFYEGDTESARQRAKKFKDYPVDKWRNLFINALNQLDEIEGEKAAIADVEDRDQKQDQLAATEPSLEFEVEAGEIALQYQNLSSVTLNYYPMDIELLFSRKPFVKEDHSHFTYIQPGFSQKVNLPKGKTAHKINLPNHFNGSNVMVEAAAGGIRHSKAYYANELAVQVIQNYGHVRVTHEKTSEPLSKVYVKVYCRLSNGQTRFYKDGYTDLRGRFDYVSISTGDLDGVREFSILVFSDKHGAVIKEAMPPKQ